MWKVSVRIAPEAEDAVAEALSREFGQPASVYTDLENGTTSASIFLRRFDSRHRSLLRQALAAIRQAGLNLGPARISARRIRRENWAHSWKRHFKPLEINSRILVLPSWSKRRAKRGRAVVILDPGLSFGTGHHATTRFCLEQVAALRDAKAAQSLLDIGTGSGIIAVAASKLGYAPVAAFDFDPDAVRVARENAAINRVEFAIARHDLTTLPIRAGRKFHVICANLIYDLLIQERRRILNRLRGGGTLVLAGTLTDQFPTVRHAYQQEGLYLVAERTADEWHSGAFRFGR